MEKDDKSTAAIIDLNVDQEFFNSEINSETDGFEKDTEALIDSEENTDNEENSNAAYLAKFFDINTDEVVARIKWAVFPMPKQTTAFAKSHIKAKPDLYGPFWICVTLVFSVAISSNISSFCQHDSPEKWHYNFHLIGWSSFVVLAYIFVLPVGLYAAFFGTPTKSATLAELFCIFGYCLTLFVPASIFLVPMANNLRWLVVLLTFSLSGSVLTLTLWPTFTESFERAKAMTFLGLTLALHLTMAVGMTLIFFSADQKIIDSPVGNSANATAVQAAANITGH